LKSVRLLNSPICRRLPRKNRGYHNFKIQHSTHTRIQFGEKPCQSNRI
jgi:hypothetical protein